MTKIAVFVSGRGSNLMALNSQLKQFPGKGEVTLVVSNKSCPALQYAKSEGISIRLVSKEPAEGFVTYDELTDEMNQREIGLIVLAGFLKKIPDNMIDEFSGKIINIHPALLPAFGGKGMYGMNVHRAVFKSSAKYSGASVHFVDKIYDHGKIIDQTVVDIHDVKSPEEIAERVLEVEHRLLPETVLKLIDNKITISKNRIIIKD